MDTVTVTARDVAAGVLAFGGLCAILWGMYGIPVPQGLVLVAGWAALWTAGALR